MSRSDYEADEKLSNHLRQRFFVWSIAIVSSLTTSGLVTLSPSPAWAQEDSTTTTDKPAEPQQSLNRAEFNELLRNREYATAAEILDPFLASDPLNPVYMSLNNSLAAGMASSQPQLAVERLEKQFRALLAVDVINAAQAQSLASTTNALTVFMRDAAASDRLALVDEASAKLEAAGNVGQESLLTLAMTKARLHVADDNAEEAKRLLDPLLESARQKIDPTAPDTGLQFLTMVTSYSSLLGSKFSEEVAAVESEAEKVALAMLQSDSPTAADFQPYMTLKMRAATRLRSSEPTEASQVLDEIQAALDAFKDRLPEEQASRIARYDQQIAGLRNQLEAALRREQLIGTTAPPLDAAHFVAMDSVTMEDLKGKVVLLDFWAVWCGPCIATFPHLIEWQEKYGDQGLVIVGVTKFYGYTWDESAGRATKSQAEEVNEEEELAMLEKFRDRYDLHHGFVVTPEGSDYSSQFQVTGIPQAVLIGKDGTIRMIRVGSGQANAEALEAEIKALLSGT